jgi:hypothetical protein
VLEIAEAMKRSGLTPAEFQKAAEKTPRDGSGRPILDAFQMQMDKAIVEKSAPSGPGAPADPSQPRPSGPSLSIRKRLNLPARPHVGPTPEGPQLIVPLDKKRQIEIGPKILPPVGPEEEPAIGGGATIRF